MSFLFFCFHQQQKKVLKSDLEAFYENRTVDKLQSMALDFELHKNEDKKMFYLDGNTLRPADLYQLGLRSYKIDVSIRVFDVRQKMPFP